MRRRWVDGVSASEGDTGCTAGRRGAAGVGLHARWRRAAGHVEQRRWAPLLGHHHRLREEGARAGWQRGGCRVAARATHLEEVKERGHRLALRAPSTARIETGAARMARGQGPLPQG